MAHRNPPQRKEPTLLPAITPKSNNEPGDDDFGAGGSGSGKQGKRAKVTAVACTPCQKRKSKCDGRRPVCTSCEVKGRNDCVYDSSNDLRRTSALKYRIDGLQLEVNDLRDILLILCHAHASGDISALNLVHANFGQGDFTTASEVAQVLRSSTNLQQLNRQTQEPQPQGDYDFPASDFALTPRTLQHSYIEGYSSIEQDASAMPASTDEQPGWPSMRGGPDVETDPELQSYPRHYTEQ